MTDLREMINKVIIWLFERYAYDDWVEKQVRRTEQEIMERYNLKNQTELNEVMADIANRPAQEAYQQGLADGYDKAMNDTL